MNGPQNKTVIESEYAQNASPLTGIEKRKKHAEYMVAWRKNNPERAKATREKWNNANHEKVKAYLKKYKKINKEKTKEQNKVSQKRWDSKNEEKVKVYKKVHIKVSNGTVVKPRACMVCGTENTRIEGHHFDYSKPYDLTWLCCACHRTIHMGGKG